MQAASSPAPSPQLPRHAPSHTTPHPPSIPASAQQQPSTAAASPLQAAPEAAGAPGAASLTPEALEQILERSAHRQVLQLHYG